jgi:hypothetical protein
MTITITDYGRVDQRVAELGCLYPDGIAILPENFDTASDRSELLHRTSATTLRKALRATSIPVSDLIPASERIPYITYKNFEWVAPTLFISAVVISQNSAAVTVALGVLSNLITEYFKGIPDKKTAKLNVIVEKRIDRTCKKISYDGDIAGIISLADVIKRIADE